MQYLNRSTRKPWALPNRLNTFNDYDSFCDKQDEKTGTVSEIKDCFPEFKLKSKENFITVGRNGFADFSQYEKVEYVGTEDQKNKKVFFSAELHELLEEMNARCGDKISQAIEHARNKINYAFIAPLHTNSTSGKCIKILGKKICELRPKLYDGNNEHYTGDVRIIGWEDENGFFFTEMGMHTDISANIKRVVCGIIEGYIQLAEKILKKFAKLPDSIRENLSTNDESCTKLSELKRKFQVLHVCNKELKGKEPDKRLKRALGVLRQKVKTELTSSSFNNFIDPAKLNESYYDIYPKNKWVDAFKQNVELRSKNEDTINIQIN